MLGFRLLCRHDLSNDKSSRNLLDYYDAPASLVTNLSLGRNAVSES